MGPTFNREVEQALACADRVRTVTSHLTRRCHCAAARIGVDMSNECQRLVATELTCSVGQFAHYVVMVTRSATSVSRPFVRGWRDIR
jgi:hypothetical protein